MSVVLLFSVFAMSACESGNTGEVTSSSETSSEEESSSSGKVSRNFGGGSSSIDTESNGNGNGLPITSTEPGGNGSTSVPEVSFSGDSFYAPETPVPDGTSANAAMLIMQIGFIEVTPSNYKTVEPTIKDAEDFYNTLTPSEKAEVINYQHLVAAREALNKIKAAGVWAEFEQGVNALPAPEALKNANVDAVYAMKDLMEENKASLSQNAGFSALEAKVTNCYNKIQSSLVERAFISQDMDGNGIVDTAELSQNKTRTSTSDGFFSVVGSSGGSSQSPACVYSDTKNASLSLTRIFKGAVQFTAECSGTVTFYPRNQSKVFIVTVDGTQVDGQWTATSSDPVAVKLPSGGVVKVTTTKGDGDAAFFAVKFSYPNLG